MSIQKLLISVPQREKAGEDSESAFGFQKNWAFHKMLQMHLAGKDYVIIFEFHDDIIFLDSELPTVITFVQVKKSDKVPWTISNLTTVVKGQKLSILAKLFVHCTEFETEEVLLKFVSDIHFNFNSKKYFNAENDISEADKKTITERMATQIDTFSRESLHKLDFEISEINFENHETHLLGEIENFIITLFGENSRIRPTTIYKALQRIGERSRRASDRITSYEELIRTKGLSRIEITDFLKSIGDYSKVIASWEDILPFLEILEIRGINILTYKAIFIRMNRRRMINTDHTIQQCFNLMKGKLKDLLIEQNLKEQITKTIEEIVIEKNEDTISFSNQELLLILCILIAESILTEEEVLS